MAASLSMPPQSAINMGRPGLSRVGSGREGVTPEVMAMSTRSIIQYGNAGTPTSSSGVVMGSVQQQQQQQPQQHLSVGPHAGQLATSQNARVSLNWHQAVRSFIFGGTAKFFGVHQLTEEASRAVWNERRRRLAVKRFGGVKDDYHLDGGVYGAQQVKTTECCCCC